MKTDVPFTLASGTKLPLSLDISETDRTNLKVKTSTIGLVTVSSNAAASVRGMLEGFPCPIRGMACIPVEVLDPETGDVTFAIRISPSGMAVNLQ